VLVYGERSRTADPRALIEMLRAELADAPALVADIRRHAALVAALIAAGELAQGLADAALKTSGVDGPDPASEAAMALTSALARAVLASWRSGFAVAPDLAPACALLNALPALPLPPTVTTKVGEGYAFYALYPEAHAEAAAALGPEPTTVVGLRSIGTSLAAMVAAALDAPPPLTVRPVGPPFRRELSLSPEYAAALSEDGGAQPARRYAVVDEGPGLSGSSFGAVLDRLEAGGVSRERIVVFPGHAGDLGPEADPVHRARWAALDRRVIGFEALALETPEPAHRLKSWVADLTGPAVAPLEDLSGGLWRSRRFADEAAWPPSHTQQERRKYRLHSDRGAYLLKFAGLGRTGERKLARARALAASGFSPEPLGLRHGFLVERWIEPAHAARPSLDRLAAYLGFRARTFPAGADDGASVEGLFAMAHANTAEGLGSRAAAAVEPWRERLGDLQYRSRPVFTDGRLHAWEWIAGPDGRVLKTDAVDHADAHDLIGAQDIAWDVAGATMEFDLGHTAAEALRRAVERVAGRAVNTELTGFLRLAYLAFQLGAWTMAAQAHDGRDEHARLTAARDRYAEQLSRATASAARA